MRLDVPFSLSRRVDGREFVKSLAAAIIPIVFPVASALAKDQEFRFEKPDARTVELIAEFNNWKAQPMTKQSDGT